MSTSNTRPIPGTDAYWRQRQQAFTLIRTLERAIEARNRASMYYYGADGIEENIGPWDRVCALQDEARRSPMAMETLTVQKRLALLDA